MSKSGVVARKLQHVFRILAAVADEECKRTMSTTLRVGESIWTVGWEGATAADCMFFHDKKERKLQTILLSYFFLSWWDRVQQSEETMPLEKEK